MKERFSLLFIASFLLMSLLVKAQPKLEECNNGLYNGNITLLTAKDNNIYAGTNLKGFFKSTDQGTNWTSIKNNLPDNQINCLTIDGNNLLLGISNRLYVSSNYGSSWVPRNNPIWGNAKINCILSDSSKHLFVGLSNGI